MRFCIRYRCDKSFLLRFVFCKQGIKAFIGNAPNGKRFVELFDNGIKLGNTLTVFVQLAFGILCDFRLSDLRSRTHLFHKLILIGDGKGAGCSDGFQNKLSDRFCPNIVTAASMSALLMCQRVGGAIVKIRGIGIVLRTAFGTVIGHFRSAVSTEQKSSQWRLGVFRSFCASSHVSLSTIASWVFSKISQSSCGFITGFLSL